MGIVGGVMPSPLHMIALAQVALKRWAVALFVLVGAPLIVDGALLLVTFFFYERVPQRIAHDVAYAGGIVLIGFATFSLLQSRHKSQQEMAQSSALTSTSVSVAILAELAAPGTWVYWLTLAGPIIAEGKKSGYGHIVPFFAGSLLGYYGAAVLSLLLMAWGAGLHKKLRPRLFLIANVLLLVLGISYLFRAYLSH